MTTSALLDKVERCLRRTHLLTHPKRPLKAFERRTDVHVFHESSVCFQSVAKLRPASLKFFTLASQFCDHVAHEPMNFLPSAVVGRCVDGDRMCVQALHGRCYVVRYSSLPSCIYGDLT